MHAAFFHITKCRRGNGDIHAHAAASLGRQRRPADVTAAFAPAHPRRGPLRLRDPDPAVVIGLLPTTIMIGCPGPRFIAGPEPAIIGQFPMAVRVRAPAGFDSCRAPALTVITDRDPFPIRAERLIKIILALNHDYCGRRRRSGLDVHLLRLRRRGDVGRLRCRSLHHVGGATRQRSQKYL